MELVSLKDSEFTNFRELLFQLTGINLSNEKKALVAGRLMKRLRFYELNTYGQYFDLIMNGNEAEKQVMVNLLSTNETYFYREDDHFDFLKEHLRNNYFATKEVRIWSAACSSGEEVYTIAFILSDLFGSGSWEVLGSDINEDVLATAREGIYPLERAKKIPQGILKKYCLKGTRDQIGKFIVKQDIRKKVHFNKINLLEKNLSIGSFDIIFLRNVMIYFNLETRKEVVHNIIRSLKKNGLLIVGHSESLLGITQKLKALKPTIYYNA